LAVQYRNDGGAKSTGDFDFEKETVSFDFIVIVFFLLFFLFFFLFFVVIIVVVFFLILFLFQFIQ
jgi:hypothetical protein